MRCLRNFLNHEKYVQKKYLIFFRSYFIVLYFYIFKFFETMFCKEFVYGDNIYIAVLVHRSRTSYQAHINQDFLLRAALLCVSLRFSSYTAILIFPHFLRNATLQLGPTHCGHSGITYIHCGCLFLSVVKCNRICADRDSREARVDVNAFCTTRREKFFFN